MKKLGYWILSLFGIKDINDLKQLGKIVLGSGVVVILISIPFIWDRWDTFQWGAPLDIPTLDSYGSFLGGLLGTWAAIAGVIYVYIQYREDKKDKEKDNIENRFFQLLDLHSKNVERIEAKRQNSFIEYTQILNSILKEIERNKKEGWTDEDMFKLSYLYFFYGFRNMEDQPLTFPSIQKNDIQEINEKLKVKKLSYSGVYLELGIYFRQLYQIVDFINGKTVLSKEEKYNYIRLLRVQLNIYEQYMLFLNSMSTLGEGWEQESRKTNQYVNKYLITKYNLIANIPNNFKQIGPFRFQDIYRDVVYEFNGKQKTAERLALEKQFN